jgi:hypothetical protein
MAPTPSGSHRQSDVNTMTMPEFFRALYEDAVARFRSADPRIRLNVNANPEAPTSEHEELTRQDSPLTSLSRTEMTMDAQNIHHVPFPRPTAHRCTYHASDVASDEMQTQNRIPKTTSIPQESLVLSYEPLDSASIEQETFQINDARALMEKRWAEEEAKYECIETIELDGASVSRPLRNFVTPTRELLHPSLFPYHSSLYALSDAYDLLCAYEFDPHDPEAIPVICQVIPSDAEVLSSEATLRERALCIQHLLPHGFSYKRCMTTSLSALVSGLLLGKPAQQLNFFKGSPEVWRDQIVCDTARALIQQHVKSYFNCLHHPSVQATFNDIGLISTEPGFWHQRALCDAASGAPWPVVGGDHPNLLLNLPMERHVRVDVLLRILKHAMSKLGRDHILANATLLRLTLAHDFDDPCTLRAALLILESGDLNCYGRCQIDNESTLDHICGLILSLRVRVGDLFVAGITHFSTAHAHVVAAFALSAFERKFGLSTRAYFEQKYGHLYKSACNDSGSVNLENDHQKKTRVEECKAIPVEWIMDTVLGLGERLALERRRLVSLLDGNSFGKDADGVPDGAIEQCIDSYHNCISCVASIGNGVLELLPTSKSFASLGGYIVAACINAYARTETSQVDSLFGCRLAEHRYGAKHRYLGAISPILKSDRSLVPDRYAKRILNATSYHQERCVGTDDPSLSRRERLARCCLRIRDGQPPQDVQDMVRGLYVRDLACTAYSRAGYGDFLAWTRCAIHPLDPVLYWTHQAHIQTERLGEEQTWDVDEVRQRKLHFSLIFVMFITSLLANLLDLRSY